MTLIYSYANISNSLLTDNIAQKVNHGITLISSYLNAYNITVDFFNLSSSIVENGFFNLNF